MEPRAHHLWWCSLSCSSLLWTTWWSWKIWGSHGNPSKTQWSCRPQRTLWWQVRANLELAGWVPWCLHFADGRASPVTMDLISETQLLCSWRLFSRVWHKGAQPQRHPSSRLYYGGAGPLVHSSPWTIGWWLPGDFMLVIIKADKL